MKRTAPILFLVLTCLFTGCEKNSDSAGVAFTSIIAGTHPTYQLDSNIVDYEDILAYDTVNHVFLISSGAGERIRDRNYPVKPTPFAVTVNGKLVYVANFIPGFSSLPCYDCIRVEPYSYDNKYRIELGYPVPDYFSLPDPRNDPRILSRMKKDHKLFVLGL